MMTSTTSSLTTASGSNSATGDAIRSPDAHTPERIDKEFATLRAAFALNGQALHRTDPADGPVTYWAERWGLVQHLPTIDTVRRFLEQIGGRL